MTSVAERDSENREKARFFEVHALGQLESGTFPGADNLYCKYWFNYGQDWGVISGVEDGLSQVAASADSRDELIVWNFPIDISFRSTNAFGWPQFGVAVYGHDSLGRDVIIGYGAIHLPTSPGMHTLTLRTFRPLSSSRIQQFLGWLRGTPPEFIDVKRASKTQGRDVTRVKSFGTVKITLNIVTRSMTQIGYNNGSQSAAATVAAASAVGRRM